MSTNSSISLSESEKFAGKNFSLFQTRLKAALAGRGLAGYLDGTITKPLETYTTQSTIQSQIPTVGTTLTQSTDIPSIPWNYTYPFVEEWMQRDAFTRSTILSNVVDPIRLGMETNGLAAQMWKSLTDKYSAKSIIGAINARAKLEGTKMAEGTDIETHLGNMCSLWRAVMRNAL